MAEMSPLRRRMIEDMTVRNLSPATQQSYLFAVTKFSRYFNRSPDGLGLEDVRAFQRARMRAPPLVRLMTLRPILHEGEFVSSFFTVKRAGRGTAAEVLLTVESAYPTQGSLTLPKRPNSIRFTVPAYKTFMGETVRFAAR